VQCGDVSRELCGGTHVTNTRELLPFEVVSIRSVGAGIRRIEAKVGSAAELFVRQREEERAAAVARMAAHEESKLQTSGREAQMVEQIERGKVLMSYFGSGIDFGALKLAAHKLRKTQGDRIHVAISEGENKNVFVAVASIEGDSESVDAREVLRRAGATGGGNSSFASGIVKKTEVNVVMNKI
jgi:alanyl-tRNA synthetase